MKKPPPLLRALPSVEKLLGTPALQPVLARYNRTYITDLIRQVLETLRQDILSGAHTTPLAEHDLIERLTARLQREDQSPLRSVVNATGTVLHTNLGRALLAQEAVDAVVRAAATPVTLEYDVSRAGRGDRDDLVEADLTALTGAEAATVVNNNAAAVLLALNTLAEGRGGDSPRVGEMIEIGGLFPHSRRSCARAAWLLREVGHDQTAPIPRDYSQRRLGTGTGVSAQGAYQQLPGSWVFTAEVGPERNWWAPGQGSMVSRSWKTWEPGR